MTHHEEHEELASRTYRSLEEEWEKATAWIMQQPDRHALLHVRGRRPMRMVTPEVKEPEVTRQFATLRISKALEGSGRPKAEVEQEIQTRRARWRLQEPARQRPIRRPEVPTHPDLIEQE